MNIRPATMADVPALTALYNELGVGTTASYDLQPVSEDERAAWLDDHLSRGWPVIVACAGQIVIGYAAYGPFRVKAGYRHTMEHSIYVSDGYQGRGVGRALMESLIGVARANRVHVLVGLIDADNAASLAFHEGLGFCTVGTLPQVGRKFDRWLDLTIQVMTL